MRIDRPMSDRRIEKLKEKGIAPTMQMLVVLEYLEKSTTHPTVEEIYEALAGKYPTFSKATVYNTVQVLKEAGIILELTIKKEKPHYDARIEHHHHFLCRRCHRIYDVDADGPWKKGEHVDGHRIEMARTYLHGLCASCLREGDYT